MQIVTILKNDLQKCLRTLSSRFYQWELNSRFHAKFMFNAFVKMRRGELGGLNCFD